MDLERPVFARRFVQFQARFKQARKMEKKKIPFTLFNGTRRNSKGDGKGDAKGRGLKGTSPFRTVKQAGVPPFSRGPMPKGIRM